MGRSAKQLKGVKHRRNAFEDGAMAVGGLISRNPVLVGGSTAFLVTLFYVSANALWYQPFPHAGAFFATRNIEGFPRTGADEPETTINIVRPGPAPVKSDPVVKQVQGILKDLDFYSGTVDGISGPNTRKAIQVYQQKVGLSASGEIDSAVARSVGRDADHGGRGAETRASSGPDRRHSRLADGKCGPTGPRPSHRQDPGRIEGIRQ